PANTPTKAGSRSAWRSASAPNTAPSGPSSSEAAKEAVKGVGFDLLYVCGFAFDPHVDEEAKRYGKLTVQMCRMNPDLAMGDDLLKKTGAGNLFMVFGEPDLIIQWVAANGGEQKTKTKRPPQPPLRKVGKNGGDASGAGGESIVVEVNGVDVYDPTTG